MATTSLPVHVAVILYLLFVCVANANVKKSQSKDAHATSRTTYNAHQVNHFSIIAFDSYGTLLDISSVTRRLRRITSSDTEAAAFNQYWRSKQLAYTQMRTLMNKYVDFWQITKDSFENSLNLFGIRNLTQAEKEFQLDSWETLDAFPDVAPSLAKLKKKYKLVVLSNGSPAMLKNGWTHSNLIGYFDQLISVDTIRKYKPHPEVYEMAEKYTCTPKSRILFVSSNSFDTTGAGRIGLTTAWVNRANVTLELTDNLGYTPDYLFANMYELANHFTNQNQFLCNYS